MMMLSNIKIHIIHLMQEDIYAVFCLSVAKKMEVMKHYENNPGLSYPKLIDRCFKKIEMKEKLSTSAVSLWFSEK